MKKQNSILITGASSGIGKKLAEDLASPEAKMCLMGRNKQRLNEIRERCTSLGAEVEVHSIDLSDKKTNLSEILNKRYSFIASFIKSIFFNFFTDAGKAFSYFAIP